MNTVRFFAEIVAASAILPEFGRAPLAKHETVVTTATLLTAKGTKQQQGPHQDLKQVFPRGAAHGRASAVGTPRNQSPKQGLHRCD